MRASDEAVLHDAVEPVVTAVGCTLYDLELTGSGRTRTLRVLVDRAGGVDLDAVTSITRALSPVLDALPALSASYLLEVSSPGIERTLRRPDHFRGAVGELVSVSFHTADGPRRLRGTLVDAGDDACTVEVDGSREHVAYGDVTRARTVFEWQPAPRPGARTRTPAKEKAARHA